MNQTVMVVGAGPTGLSAAHACATAGRKVVLVEKEARLGGAPILSGYAKLVPSGEWAKDAIGRMVARVEGHPSITVKKGATVAKLDGGPGDFTATLSDGSSVQAGAVILGTGFTHFDSINKPEWGCCTVSTNLAMEIRELSPKTDVYIYYMDIRTFGLYEDKFYWRSQEEFCTKFVKARIAEVTIAPDGKRLLVKGEDTLVKRPIVIPFDLVVHAIGMDPNLDNPTIARAFGVGLEPHGFLERGEHYTSTFSSTRPGVYVGGSALGPEDIDTCISHGLAMAMRAIGDLSAKQAA